MDAPRARDGAPGTGPDRESTSLHAGAFQQRAGLRLGSRPPYSPERESSRKQQDARSDEEQQIETGKR